MKIVAVMRANRTRQCINDFIRSGANTLQRIRPISTLLAICSIVLVSCVAADGSAWQSDSPLAAALPTSGAGTDGDFATSAGIGSTSLPMQQPAGNGAFPTPEDAITHYLNGVAQNDVGMILAATAFDAASEGYDFAYEVDRLAGLNLAQFLSPPNTKFYADINRVRVAAQILQQVKMLSYRLLAGDIDALATTYAQVDADTVTALLESLDPARLADLQVVEIGSQPLTTDPFYSEIAARKAKVYGAGDFTERVALVEFEENDYIVGFSLLRYGDDWRVLDQSSPLAGLSPLGIPETSTKEGFESMILDE
jgi:hypothetical protein